MHPHTAVVHAAAIVAAVEPAIVHAVVHAAVEPAIVHAAVHAAVEPAIVHAAVHAAVVEPAVVHPAVHAAAVEPAVVHPAVHAAVVESAVVHAAVHTAAVIHAAAVHAAVIVPLAVEVLGIRTGGPGGEEVGHAAVHAADVKTSVAAVIKTAAVEVAAAVIKTAAVVETTAIEITAVIETAAVEPPAVKVADSLGKDPDQDIEPLVRVVSVTSVVRITVEFHLELFERFHDAGDLDPRRLDLRVSVRTEDRVPDNPHNDNEDRQGDEQFQQRKTAGHSGAGGEGSHSYISLG